LVVRAATTIGSALVAVAFWAGIAGAGVDKKGFYDVYQGGVRVGSERYWWEEREEGTAVLAADCVLEINGVSTTLRPSLTLVSESLTPVGLDLEASHGGNIQEFSAKFDGPRAEYVQNENGMESKKTLKIKPADLVLDENLLHQFIVLAERYDFDKAGEQDFTVFDVEQKKAYTAHVKVKGLGTFENEKGSFRMRRLSIDLESNTVDLLVDREGRVPSISIPMKKLEAKLQGYDGGEKAEVLGTK
jgi:hypothetical protein